MWHDGLHRIPDGLLLGVPGDLVALGEEPAAECAAASCGRRSSRCCPPSTTRRLRRDADPRPLRRRGPRAPRRRPRRQHLRRRHRPLQPGDGPPAGVARCRPAQPVARRPAGPARRGAGRAGRSSSAPTHGHGGAGDGGCGAAPNGRARSSDGRRRSTSLARDGAGWRVDDDPADAVVLATPAVDSARLVAPSNPPLAEPARARRTRQRCHHHAGGAGIARVSARDERLPRPQTRSAPRDGGFVRFAEVGPLAGTGRHRARVARSRRPADRRPRRRHARRRRGRRARRAPRRRHRADRRARRAAGRRRSRSTDPATSAGSPPSTPQRRPACSSPGRAIAASACRRASPTPSARRPLSWPTSRGDACVDSSHVVLGGLRSNSRSGPAGGPLSRRLAAQNGFQRGAGCS